MRIPPRSPARDKHGRTELRMFDSAANTANSHVLGSCRVSTNLAPAFPFPAAANVTGTWPLAHAHSRATQITAQATNAASPHTNRTEAQTQGDTTQTSRSDCAHSAHTRGENEEMHALLALEVLVLHARLVHPDAPHRPHALLGRQEARGRGRVWEELRVKATTRLYYSTRV